jgi:hypothetical protein
MSSIDLEFLLFKNYIKNRTKLIVIVRTNLILTKNLVV